MALSIEERQRRKAVYEAEQSQAAETEKARREKVINARHLDFGVKLANLQLVDKDTPTAEE